MSDARAVAYYCPYCGDEDLEPDGDTGGRWHCRSCTRTFQVRQVRSAPAPMSMIQGRSQSDPPVICPGSRGRGPSAALHPVLAPLGDRLALPSAGVVTPLELVGLTATLASEIPLLEVVRYDPHMRWWVRLALTDAVEVWLLGWRRGQATEPHDHGGAHGACTVLAGTLHEQVFDATSARQLASQVNRAGVTVPLAAHHAHAITAQSRAASVHAYSPPLLPARPLVAARRAEPGGPC